MAADLEKDESAGTGGGPLKVHDLRPAPGSNRRKIRKGRGEASKGKTAGRGTKGTKARATVPVGFEGGQMPLRSSRASRTRTRWSTRS